MVRRRRCVTVALGALLLTLPGCGDKPPRIATIGVIAPISGDLTALGTGIRNSVDLAVREANHRHAVRSWTLRLAARDDRATPAVGARHARELARDHTVVGVIGTYNSGVAAEVIPILDRSGI